MGCPLVVLYWADLQSVHGLRCYGNITRTRNVSEYVLVLAVCLDWFDSMLFQRLAPLSSVVAPRSACCGICSAESSTWTLAGWTGPTRRSPSAYSCSCCASRDWSVLVSTGQSVAAAAGSRRRLRSLGIPTARAVAVKQFRIRESIRPSGVAGVRRRDEWWPYVRMTDETEQPHGPVVSRRNRRKQNAKLKLESPQSRSYRPLYTQRTPQATSQ